VIDTLVQTARPYIYTTAAPPLLAATLLTALDLLRDEHHRRRTLARHVERFRAGAASLPWRLLASSTAIQPLLVGGDAAALALAAFLWERGIWAPAIRPPTVPQGSARLRVSLSAAHADADVDRLLAALDDAARAGIATA
jgi:8-amino-7-oxononanoate synthase